MAEDLSEAIEENAEAPAEMQGDGRRVRSEKLTEQIAADRYLRATEAAGSNGLPIRFGRLRPPGTV